MDARDKTPAGKEKKTMRNTIKKLDTKEMNTVHGGESSGSFYFGHVKDPCPDCGGTNIRVTYERKWWLMHKVHWKCLDCNPDVTEPAN